MFKKAAALITPLVLVAVTAGAVLLKMHKKERPELIVSGAIESQEIQVGSKVGGRITAVLVAEGDMVAPGQTLVRFDVESLMAEQRLQEARVEQALAYLSKLEAGYRPEEIEQAEAAAGRELAALEALRNGARVQEIEQARFDLAGAKADLENARITHERINSLYLQGVESRQRRDEAHSRLEQASARVASLDQRAALIAEGTRAEELRAAEARYRQARANAQMLRAGYRSEDIADARARVREAQAALARLKIQVAEGEVKAPAACRVETLSVRPGDLMAAGAPIAKLLEQDQLWVQVYVPEPELGRVKVGQRAQVTIDTFPDRSFAGTVERIADEGEFTPRNVLNRSERSHQVFAVKVAVDNSAGLLKPGMAADVRLAVKE